MAQVIDRREVKADASGSATGGRLFGLDRFSLAIALGTLLLVGVLFLLVLRQPAETQPMDETSPAGVVHNYYLALMNDDVRTAYDYLAEDARAKTPYDQFARQVSNARSQSSRRVRIGDERVEGDTARVTVRRTYSTGGGLFPFSSGEYTQETTWVLRREQGSWRLTQGSWYAW
jgi:hypothetical protein